MGLIVEEKTLVTIQGAIFHLVGEIKQSYKLKNIGNGICFDIPKLKLQKMRESGEAEFDFDIQINHDLRPTLEDLSEGDQNTVYRYLPYLLEMRKGEPGKIKSSENIYRARKIVSKEIGDPDPPGRSTLAEKYKKWEESGYDPYVLAGGKGGNGEPRYEQELYDLCFDAIWDNYLQPRYESKHSYNQTTQKANREAILLKLSVHNANPANKRLPDKVSKKFVKKLISSLDWWLVYEKRFGREAMLKKRRTPNEPPPVTFPLERVEMDGKLLNIFVKDDFNDEILGRPYVVVSIDVLTKDIHGIHISFRHEPASAILQCLLFGAKNKDFLNEQYPKILLSTWDFQGIPVSVWVDKGKGFVSNSFKVAAATLDFEYVELPKKQPHLKGTVENFNKTIITDLLRNLPGYSYKNPSDRGDSKPEKDELLTFSQFVEKFVVWIVDRYRHTKNHMTGKTPAEMTKDWIAKNGRSIFEHGYSNERLRTLLGNTGEAKIVNNKLRNNYIYYSSPEFTELIPLFPEGEKIKFKYDEYDLSWIAVKHPDPREGYIKLYSPRGINLVGIGIKEVNHYVQVAKDMNISLDRELWLAEVQDRIKSSAKNDLYQNGIKTNTSTKTLSPKSNSDNAEPYYLDDPHAEDLREVMSRQMSFLEDGDISIHQANPDNKDADVSSKTSQSISIEHDEEPLKRNPPKWKSTGGRK